MAHSIALKLGTRGSALARWQADWVAAALSRVGVAVEIVRITTQGDSRSGPIGGLGIQGVFTKEIQRALLECRIDLAVHSLKDLPTDPVDGLVLAAVPPRARPGDALVCRAAGDLDALQPGARVGTGSVRRQAQLLHARPDLQPVDIRGNVDTRLDHLDRGRYDALVLAEAGLARLGRADRITQVLPKEWMLPAVGQGALGLETRADDQVVRQVIRVLDDPVSHQAVAAERALLAALHGGCLAPVGAWARLVAESLVLDAAVLDPLGTRRLAVRVAGPPAEAPALGRQAADALLQQGAGALIAAGRWER